MKLLVLNIIVVVCLIVGTSACDRQSKKHISEKNGCTQFDIETNKKFEILFFEIEKLIRRDWECPKVNIEYKELRISEEKEIHDSFYSIINDYAVSFGDSLILEKSFKVSDFSSYCQSQSSLTGGCTFYFGLIYYSKDNTIQYLRLFQEGNHERFDLLIRLDEDGHIIERIAFG